MKAVILCGGKGTRMREETEFKPKPLVEIGEMPILWHIMKIYSYYGFNDFVLCLGYKGNMIKDYFLNFEWFTNDFTLQLGDGNRKTRIHTNSLQNWNITFANTGEETDTGGRVKKIEKYIDDEDFFLTYGDAVANINIQDLLAYHKKMDKVATVTAVHPSSRFGVLEVDDNGIARSFLEKPLVSGVINGGFFALKNEVFDYLDEDSNFEKDGLMEISRKGELSVFGGCKYWQCMDTYKEAEEFNKQWKKGIHPWVVW
ncbi:MAG TPA: glucose-1-phosphate cytidylyltransferase [Methanocella sp.]|jgi:glucose-1-phosphate cytidylyltransferase